MAQKSSVRQQNDSGSKPKGSKVDSDVHLTLLYNDLKSAGNSVGLIDPFFLESTKPKKKTTFNANNVVGETILNPTKSRVFPPGQWYPSEEFLLKQQNKKTAIATQKTSIKKADKNLIEQRRTTPNRTKVTTIVLNDKASTDELDIKDVVTKKTSDAKRDEKSIRQLRSSRKYAEPVHKPRSVVEFSIEIMDWYYEDPNYYKKICEEVLSDFAIPKDRRPSTSAKLCYTYLLLDSRRCRDKKNISWLDFIKAIFYIGKGTDGRAFQHAKDTEKWLTTIDSKKKYDKKDKKYVKIKEIWDSGNPMKVFIVWEEITGEEAFTREAAMIDAMGLRRLCNKKHGSYYGVAETMKVIERLVLGATLLMEARDIFRWKKVFDA